MTSQRIPQAFLYFHFLCPLLNYHIILQLRDFLISPRIRQIFKHLTHDFQSPFLIDHYQQYTHIMHLPFSIRDTSNLKKWRCLLELSAISLCRHLMNKTERILQDSSNPIDFGICRLREQKRLRNMVTKPQLQGIPSSTIILIKIEHGVLHSCYRTIGCPAENIGGAITATSSGHAEQHTSLVSCYANHLLNLFFLCL